MRPALMAALGMLLVGLALPVRADEPMVGAAPAWAGLSLRDTPAGARIERVFRGAPASAAGLRAGDVVVAVEGRRVERGQEVTRALRAQPAGARVRVQVQREAALVSAEVTLAPLPSPEGILRAEWQGQRLPSLPLRAAAGVLPARLDELRGRVVVLAFGATWCPACRAAEPTLSDWSRRFAARGLLVVGVQHEEPEAVAEAALARRVGHPVSADPDEGISEAVGVTALPTLVVLGRDGRVRDVALGFDEERWARVAASFEHLLAEGPPRTEGTRPAADPGRRSTR
jgi:peroxiredoxin